MTQLPASGLSHSSKGGKSSGKHKRGGYRIQVEAFLSLSRNILSFSNHGPTRIAFLREISTLLLDFSDWDEVELRQQAGELTYLWRMSRNGGDRFHFEILPDLESPDATPLDKICRMLIRETLPPDLRAKLCQHSLVLSDRNEALAAFELGSGQLQQVQEDRLFPGALILVPFISGEESRGILVLKGGSKEEIFPRKIEYLEDLALTLALASVNRRAQEALRERVKELTCLYDMAKIADDRGLGLDLKLQRIVNLLPVAWHYPDIAVAKIELDGRTYLTPGYNNGRFLQKAEIVIFGKKRGLVEVAYVAGRPEFVEGAFLNEEASLILEVARQVASLVEREESESEKVRLEEQLRHADRLATIGKIAAGVAHELNEPLASILGFAQLSRKALDNPKQVGADLDRIINTSLNAREIVRKLLIFARQMPTQKKQVDINATINEALSLLETRCKNKGIQLVRQLAEYLPTMDADPVQLNQVVVNLVVNAIQAMPYGGTITVQSSFADDSIAISVEDTGTGMTDDVIQHIFTPFYTTKDVQQGTGLGLSVVHGIVSEHGGTIDVASEVNKGSKFIVRLPHTVQSNEKQEISQ
jgi:signal transduction histidine kinase